MVKTMKLIGISFLITLAVISCKHNEGDYHGIHERITKESENFKGTTISSDAYINEIKTIEITEGDHTFLIPERKSQIKSYACSDCHTVSLSELKDRKNIKKAHWDINLNHANEKIMNCATCHNGSAMDHLKSLTNTKIDFNKSYVVCSQCHTKQFKDWKGGAHGKRIASWAPPRLSNTCVNCHNPHDPHFETKFPDRFNTQYEKERK
ncbi:MAG: cytochrome C [Flavobacteriaceae bacterium]|nr:cytochrome C [Flavobacteriaceae bacterium]